jgi:tetratricopeptide (TPR) repeat protein
VQKAQGDLARALASYRDSLAIIERLAKSEHSNAGWQLDLSVSYDRIGDVLTAQGDLAGSLRSYRDGLTIRERLAKSDPSNVGWQRALSVSYAKIGDALAAQGDLVGALKLYGDRLAITQRLVLLDPTNKQFQRDLSSVIDRIGGMAFRFVLARNFAAALQAVDQAIALKPDEIWLYTNRAHALMFAGRIDQARSIYLKYRGTKDVGDGKSWETTILEDFAELRKAGVTNPLMDEIEKLFTSAG